MKTYTYDSAARLIMIDGPSSTVELSYNGLGQRLSMDAAGVIAHYVMDGDRPLTAESSGNTTFYLYGLGAIGEKTNNWSYSLPDGTSTPRQLTNPNGEITLAGRYTPWGDVLEVQGVGNFTFGYLGGILDAATNLIYVGNGQYYDPATGRFLTRDVNPDSTNPYVPWNPIGAILGPLGLISLVASRKRGKTNPYLLMFVILVVLPVGVGMACSDSGSLTPTQPNQPPIVGIVTPGPSTTQYAPIITPTSSITPLTVPCDCTATPSFSYLAQKAVEYALAYLETPNPAYNYYDPATNNSDCTNFVSQALFAGGLALKPGIWEPYANAWIQTPALYEYLTQNFQSATYTNDPLYEPYSFQPLRGYSKWERFLQDQKPNINAGDLVFYWDQEIYLNWGHVALITSSVWKPETVHVLKNDPALIQYSFPGALKPEIVEHHGPTFEANGTDIARSIDDTTNLYLKYVSIVFMSKPK